MYIESYPILASRLVESEDIFAKFALWPTNGHHVRTPWGERFLSLPQKKYQIHYSFETDHGKHTGPITDKLIVSRVLAYMENYYGKQITNCSSLANFLTTGIFVECAPLHRYLVITQGMRVYNGQKIAVGDMVCMMFANEQYMESRKNRLRPDYMKVKKKRRASEQFGNSMATVREVYTANEIENLYRDTRVDGFHFMVCVAKHEGKPVWLSQRGWYRPDGLSTPLVLTIGMHEGYKEDVPLVTLIKKRR